MHKKKHHKWVETQAVILRRNTPKMPADMQGAFPPPVQNLIVGCRFPYVINSEFDLELLQQKFVAIDWSHETVLPLRNKCDYWV